MSAEELLRDRYEVLHRLGAGTGGAVYKAVQRSTGQTVAVKLLSLDHIPKEAHERPIERFRREIAFYSRLNHPDIVRLLDSGELRDGTHFAVFEYIPGQTLAQLLNEAGALTVQRARSLMMQLLPPLAHAHAHGIFHRDLKPSNVMVSADGTRDRVKILDFGISIAVGREDDEVRRLTMSHEWVGTPTYAAPEQLRGEPPGARSDLYAWGLIFSSASPERPSSSEARCPRSSRSTCCPNRIRCRNRCGIIGWERCWDACWRRMPRAGPAMPTRCWACSRPSPPTISRINKDTCETRPRIWRARGPARSRPTP